MNENKPDEFYSMRDDYLIVPAEYQGWRARKCKTELIVLPYTEDGVEYEWGKKCPISEVNKT